jgi:hypothetical protein
MEPSATIKGLQGLSFVGLQAAATLAGGPVRGIVKLAAGLVA